MQIWLINGAARLALAALLVLPASVAVAADTETTNFKVADEVAIYYAIVPAEMIRGHPKEHTEATMHGGVPKGEHYHHLMVALFESGSLERIADAEVTATVREIGLGGNKKPLEPFEVAGAVTYGNYFQLRTRTLYRITVAIKRPPSSKVIETGFEYNHH